jgi:3-hydroxyisobutyrate dehydrogenase-like beta-hydroxyacid dehydrogenase
MTAVSNQRVGFVGLGDQGGPMALAIVEAGFLLHACPMTPLGGAAFEGHDDPASLAREADVLALCLRDQHIHGLIEQHGLLDVLRLQMAVDSL